MSTQREELANLKIGKWKLSSLRNRKKKRLKKSKPSLKDLWDTIKRTNIHIMEVP